MKKTICLLFLTLMVFSLIGCTREGATGYKPYVPKVNSSSQLDDDSEYDVDNSVGQDIDVTEKATPTPTQEPKKTAKPIPTGHGEISQNLADCQFIFDAVTVSLPCPLQTFTDLGWQINLDDFISENGSTLIESQNSSGLIEMYNPAYSEDFYFTVEFKNPDSTPKELTQCEIFYVNFDTTCGFELVDAFPSIEIAKGLKWGSTYEQIIEAFGKPNEENNSDFGYTTLYYDFDTASVSLTVYQDFGFSSISFYLHPTL
ncbi:MAG: hypothetical protein RR902_01225 [Oscillospiraceae bacterium]